MIPLATLARYEQLRERYGKLEALAKGVRSTDPATRREAESAATQARSTLEQVEDIEREHPGVQATFAKVVRVASGGAEVEPPGGSLGATVFGAFERHLRAGADRFAAGVAGELSGANRWGELRRGDYVLRVLECAAGQVCVELRARADDLGNTGRREVLLDQLDRELRLLARQEHG